MQGQGKKVWAFALGNDAVWIENLKEAGFEQRWSMSRRRVLGWQRLQRKDPDHEAARAPEVTSRI
jgi:hypothetical protein